MTAPDDRRQGARSPSGWSAWGGVGGRTCQAGRGCLSVQRPQWRQPGPQLPDFLAPLCAKHRSPTTMRGNWGSGGQIQGPTMIASGFKSSWSQCQSPTIPVIPRVAPIPTDLIKLCLKTLRPERSSPLKGLQLENPGWCWYASGHKRMRAFWARRIGEEAGGLGSAGCGRVPWEAGSRTLKQKAFLS